jgi:NDP-sugar pyrophosphorylase family protein
LLQLFFSCYPLLLFTLKLLFVKENGFFSFVLDINYKAERINYYFQKILIEQATLLIDIFRHKLVHLAQPQFVYTDNHGKKLHGDIIMIINYHNFIFTESIHYSYFRYNYV